ncbi:hypothetical protein CVT26_014469 [Gymnopilus dilepis]|uniref:Uncharacterized protein n=1 Tax=Gymnopilus dilepis TaxID=231916 RepID=A0A409VVD2_9AGAR|nr:hypothetical protein CVT26_014469 [Gymnopilus dilepis]
MRCAKGVVEPVVMAELEEDEENQEVLKDEDETFVHPGVQLMFCRNASRRRQILHIPATTPRPMSIGSELSPEKEIGNFSSTLLIRPPIWRRPAKLSSGSSADSGSCLRVKLSTLSVHIHSSGGSPARTSSPALPPIFEVAVAPSPMTLPLPLFRLLSRLPSLPSTPLQAGQALPGHLFAHSLLPRRRHVLRLWGGSRSEKSSKVVGGLGRKPMPLVREGSMESLAWRKLVAGVAKVVLPRSYLSVSPALAIEQTQMPRSAGSVAPSSTATGAGEKTLKVVNSIGTKLPLGWKDLLESFTLRSSVAGVAMKVVVQFKSNCAACAAYQGGFRGRGDGRAGRAGEGEGGRGRGDTKEEQKEDVVPSEAQARAPPPTASNRH